jgi:ribonuclease HI
MKNVDIYTDGACLGNPGKGGYGAVLIYRAVNGEVKKEISAGYELTTNNRMEIMAAIAALELLKEPCNVVLYSDSRYLVDAVQKGWLKKWSANNWMRTKTEKALNVDLWKRMIALSVRHKVEFRWVKGHADNEFNNRCDRLARAAADGDGLLVDEGYGN